MSFQTAIGGLQSVFYIQMW